MNNTIIDTPVTKTIVRWLSILIFKITGWQAVFISGLCLLTGCSTFSYYTQAVEGQCQLMLQKKPIPDMLAKGELTPSLAQKLNLVLDIRKFAETELKLPVKDSYLHYVDLKRPYVVWNVFACPPLSLTPKSWYYPVVGRLTYRGFFMEDMAKAYAEKLSRKGLDVYVGGVPAYSTLGWFNDPVTNVMLQRKNERLAELIFHELAHQVLYLSGDTAFNESFATAVAEEGVKQWLEGHASESGNVNDITAGRKRHQAFVALVLEYRGRLEKLYASSVSDDIKLAKKKEIIQVLKKQYQILRNKWQGYSGYDDWFSLPINNAQLSTISTYHDFVPAFLKMLTENGGDFSRFYASCKALGKLEENKRHKKLDEMVRDRFQVDINTAGTSDSFHP